MANQPDVVRALLFDLDGVLIDSFHAWLRLVNQAAREFGHAAIGEAAFRRSFGQSSAADVDEFFPDRTVAELDAFFATHFRDHLEAVTINPEGPPLLEHARRAGLRTACVTNTVQPLAEEILAVTRLRPLLDIAVGAGPPRRPKPEPDLVRAAADAVGTPLAACALVGDSAFDVEAGRRAPVFTIGLGIAADARVEHLRDVSRWIPSPLA
ncbi:MAG: HAD family hydrolase [Planctomycetes bacterium]|nr:HAD family hydrolase [Planctomycetota bacterium]MBI3845378.1 HAD family hydrolase [Planctomycetota bacterium]